MKKEKLTCIILLIVLSLMISACSANETSGASVPDGLLRQEIRDGIAQPSAAPSMPEMDAGASGGAPGSAPGGIGRPPELSPGESYLVISENLAVSTDVESTLTFSLKVDTAAYTNVARFIESGNLPPRDAVRTEELINYFSYDGSMRFDNNAVFAMSAEVGPSPFNAGSYLAFIRVKSKDIDRTELPPSNLTFLIDSSGSMSSHDRMPLLKESFALLVETLTEDDRVSIVTYAGTSEILLDGMSGADKDRILSVIDSLQAGGSTAGGHGIQTAYSLAEKNYMPNANNRVILATDGDFNVGVSSNAELARLVGEKRGNGIYLSVLGYGMGNIRDDLMETLSREGNGNYFYINNLASAKKALVDELAANLYTIADDVKAQVEFNPHNVRSYRLIGYENRRLSNEDFLDDSKDAGEVGIGTDVIMMFELELHSGAQAGRYAPANNVQPDFADELFEVRLSYKHPGEDASNYMAKQVFFDDIAETGSTDFRFAAAVAAFAHLLRGSEHARDVALDDVHALAEGGLGADFAGYRRDFIRLLTLYERLV